MKSENGSVLGSPEVHTEEFDGRINHNVAFALGGLAGNNAFGAGFLQAALDHRTDELGIPAMITATSGQVYWVYRYLQNIAPWLTHEKPLSLQQCLENDLGSLTPPGLFAGELAKVLPRDIMDVLEKQLHSLGKQWEYVPFTRDFAWGWLSLFGKPGRYGPGFHHLLPDCIANAQSAFKDILCQIQDRKIGRISAIEFLSSILPDRWIEIAFPDSLIKDISTLFNEVGSLEDQGIGVVFNAYNPIEGIEYIYMNKRAKHLLGRQYGKESSHRWRTRYLPIDSGAVRSSLWLYAYGFHDGNCTLDGAYYREVILSEACGSKINTIFSVRPISPTWIGDLPHSYISGKDLETEVAFNGTYTGERDKIMLINKLIRDRDAAVNAVKNAAGNPLPAEFDRWIDQLKNYQPIELVELEPETQRGYFDYVFEDMSLFEAAKKKALHKFRDKALIP